MKDLQSEFQDFYNELDDKKDIFYMFFTSGLLFWANKSLSLVPKTENIVVIGAGLTDTEVEWIKNSFQYPFFHIDHYVDDRVVWELLMHTNEFSFGWLDVDCFVFDPQIFHDMKQIDDDTAINSIWSWESNLEFEFQNTYMMFFNVKVYKELKAKGIHITPYAYAYEHMMPETNVDIHTIQKEHIEIMEKVIPLDLYPIAKYSDHGLPFFDTLLLYQIITRAYGYKMKKVRNLSFNHYVSNEIIHVGDASYFTEKKGNKPKFLTDNYKIYLYIAYLILDSMMDKLPQTYRVQMKLAKSRLLFCQYNIEDAKEFVNQYMTQRGICKDVIERLINFK